MVTRDYKDLREMHGVRDRLCGGYELGVQVKKMHVRMVLYEPQEMMEPLFSNLFHSILKAIAEIKNYTTATYIQQHTKCHMCFVCLIVVFSRTA